MSREINCKAVLKDNAISCKASLGQTVIVTEGPETYTGPVTVTPTESEQTLLTKDKLLTDNITVNPIPSEYTDAKADYEDALTAFGVQSDLADGINALTEYSNEITGEQDETLSDAVRSLADGFGGEWGDGVLIFDHTFDADTGTFSITALPNGEPFSFDRIVCEFDFPNNGVNSGWRQYWRSDLSMTGNTQYMVSGGVSWVGYSDALLKTVNEFAINGENIELISFARDRNNNTRTSAQYKIVDCGTYNKITAYAWWAHVISAGTHMTITGYNRK